MHVYVASNFMNCCILAVFISGRVPVTSLAPSPPPAAEKRLDTYTIYSDQHRKRHLFIFLLHFISQVKLIQINHLKPWLMVAPSPEIINTQISLSAAKDFCLH
jgi:hypothetical protein